MLSCFIYVDLGLRAMTAVYLYKASILGKENLSHWRGLQAEYSYCLSAIS